MGVGLPLKVDTQTLYLDQALHARILVDVDCTKVLPDRLVVTVKNEAKRLVITFFVSVEYENAPKYCRFCCVMRSKTVGSVLKHRFLIRILSKVMKDNFKGEGVGEEIHCLEHKHNMTLLRTQVKNIRSGLFSKIR